MEKGHENLLAEEDLKGEVIITEVIYISQNGHDKLK